MGNNRFLIIIGETAKAGNVPNQKIAKIEMLINGLFRGTVAKTNEYNHPQGKKTENIPTRPDVKSDWFNAFFWIYFEKSVSTNLNLKCIENRDDVNIATPRKMK